MSKRGGAVHVTTNRRHYKGKDYETVLLRHSYREDGKVKNETVANLSALPPAAIVLIRSSLAGKEHVVAGSDFGIERSLPHGHVAAVWARARSLGFPGILGPACPERDLAMSLIIARVCEPGSKLATSRWWVDTTLGVDLGVEGASSDAIYRSMDWLVDRQASIEKTLAGRHLSEGGLVYYDLSSSWMEGSCCPLAARGYSRDHKSGKTQIEYGLLADPEGRPVAVEVFSGNTADPTAFIAAVAKVRTRFSLGKVVMVGDRGMITSARIAAIAEANSTSSTMTMGWITALRAPDIKKLALDATVQITLFDEANLAEITHPDFPDERLVACRNPALATLRAAKREELLVCTEALLGKVAASVDAGRLSTSAKIGVAAGKVIGRYKMAKHFTLEIADGSFSYPRKVGQIAAEAALDGIYIIRTSVDAQTLAAAEVVAAYKALANVERDFRSLKAIDLDLRPIYHHLEARVRAHVLICMLASYLVWHLRKDWAPLCFSDEAKPERVDPVAPAQRSAAAETKASRRKTTEGLPAHNFATLINHLATLTRNRIVFTGGVAIDMLSDPTSTQRQAFELIGAAIPVVLK
jgi:hypothetical protein